MNDKIFVMLPAYMDPDLGVTLTTMYENAENPENLTIAVGMSYFSENEIPKYTDIPEHQIHKLFWHAKNRPGTMKVRNILNSFYTDEQYYLSVDSHMIFAERWDTTLKQELNDLASIVEKDKVILINHDRSSKFFVSESKISPLFEIAGTGFKLVPEIENRFTRSDFLFAGLFFTYGNFAKDVGWIEDVNMIEEEPYMAFRSYVKGWDIYHNFISEQYAHNPKNYYNVVRNMKHIGWNKDPERYRVEVLIALIFNDYSHFAVKEASRTPAEWWNKIGLAEEYEKYKKLFVEYDVVNNIDSLAEKF
jgi:hypothetical protein